MPLPREHLLDELATAYVQAIAAVAGATIAVSRRDYGVDGVVKDIATSADGHAETGFPLEFQLKGTTVARRGQDGIRHDLRARNYNLIVSRPALAIPYYLFLVCFDTATATWAVAEDHRLVLNASAFWWAQSGNRSENAASVRIEISPANRLTPDANEVYAGYGADEVHAMIDAGPSLEAAKGLQATDLLQYLLRRGWTARPSRVEGISIVSKDVPDFDKPILFILPVTPGWEDEQRRVADALRTVEAIERRPMARIVSEARALARGGYASDEDQSLPVLGGFRDDPDKT